MTARLTITCDGPDCQATTVAEHDGHGQFPPPAGWLRVWVDENHDDDHLVAEYCGWTCYAADVVRHAMDGGDRG